MMKRLRAFSTVAASLLTVPLLAGAAVGPEEEESGIYARQLSTGEVFYVEELDDLIAEPAPAEPGTITPFLIDDPFAWAACFGPAFNADYPLRSYPYVPEASGNVYLQCGPNVTKTYGWHHIQDQHQDQWQARVDAIGVGGYWDDLMAWMNDMILSWPDRYTVEYGGKRCYTSTFAMSRTPDGPILFTYSPTVVVSMTNNRIITSYPTTTQDCRRQAAWAY